MGGTVWFVLILGLVCVLQNSKTGLLGGCGTVVGERFGLSVFWFWVWFGFYNMTMAPIFIQNYLNFSSEVWKKRDISELFISVHSACITLNIIYSISVTHGTDFSFDIKYSKAISLPVPGF